ncbi:MAG: hypothetical protein LBM93_06040 [Oscillospiraceae bacterium]|jgi:hypothetical protein|nr:hypothetical protein [Oscillospiraceae bacterium]
MIKEYIHNGKRFTLDTEIFLKAYKDGIYGALYNAGKLNKAQYEALLDMPVRDDVGAVSMKLPEVAV